MHMHYRFVASMALIFFVSVASLSQSKPSAPAKPSTAASPDAQIYRNSTYRFRYQIPFGWVERTKQMREGGADSKGEVLLGIFERPPEATGSTVNSAVVIASESVESYPGLKSAEDYLVPLTELTTSNGFQPEGGASIIEIDGWQLVRADFLKEIEIKKSDANADKLSMRQRTLVILSHHQIVSFTFIGGSDDELDSLVSNLHFGTAKAGAR